MNIDRFDFAGRPGQIQCSNSQLGRTALTYDVIATAGFRGQSFIRPVARDQLELPRDESLVTEKMQSALAGVALKGRIRERFAEWNAAPKNSRNRGLFQVAKLGVFVARKGERDTRCRAAILHDGERGPSVRPIVVDGRLFH